MRIEYTKVVAQTVQDRNPQDGVDEPIGLNYGRASKLADIEQAALDFAYDLLLTYDLPSTPKLRLGRMRGFEDTKKAFVDVVGYVTINADVYTPGQYTIRLELAIPVHKGTFQKPSIVIHNSKKKILSQDLIDQIVSAHETNKPIVNKPLTPDMNFQHRENVEKPMFSAPDDPSGWSLLVTERY